ncbi:hypothetical protein [Pseudoclavibacter endophyticus]|uniref:Uncharacterized protein n=1 Tax=Pseudoclavibacter endophyticus TaxID=1778590 RepID=A0A6H9WLC2_9MICO|nr:hypothetical protein [Pseudoclavibacter endophyticus]KAB1646712.1 hypothetical protein F8O04_13260 [Pseudoclavibacter endophyticus]
MTNAKNKQGKISPSFVCAGRRRGNADRTRQAMLIEEVEHLIEQDYQHIQVSPVMRQSIAGRLHAEFDRLMATETAELGHT